MKNVSLLLVPVVKPRDCPFCGREPFPTDRQATYCLLLKQSPDPREVGCSFSHERAPSDCPLRHYIVQVARTYTRGGEAGQTVGNAGP